MPCCVVTEPRSVELKLHSLNCLPEGVWSGPPTRVGSSQDTLWVSMRYSQACLHTPDLSRDRVQTLVVTQSLREPGGICTKEPEKVKPADDNTLLRPPGSWAEKAPVKHRLSQQGHARRYRKNTQFLK